MGADVDAAHVAKYREAIGKAAKSGDLSFQQWFCKSSSLKQSEVRGFWDFAVHILTPKVIAEISDPENKTALEIGYGGGRLLRAAGCFFGKEIGVDIHDSLPNIPGVTLLTGDGKTIPVESETVDFVYSFIVFLHLQSFEAFVSYLNDTHRVLKRGGIAQLYFGLKDGDGYCCSVTPANHASLDISQKTAEAEAEKAGFQVIDLGRSYKSVPNGFPNVIGQQGYMTLKKPR